MGLEGAVKLGYRTSSRPIADPDERRALFEQMVAAAYERGKALNTATYFEIDDVIDPADSRELDRRPAWLGAERRPARAARGGRASTPGDALLVRASIGLLYAVPVMVAGYQVSFVLAGLSMSISGRYPSWWRGNRHRCSHTPLRKHEP